VVDTIDPSGHRRGTMYTSLPGLLRIIFKSRKPEAVRFQDWVYDDALPELLTTGSYLMPAREPVEKAQIAYNACVKMAGSFGLQGNQALLAANRATRQLTGLDPMELLGVTHLVAPVQERLVTPTEVAQKLGLFGGKQGNLLLEGAGYQVRNRDHAGRLVWSPTDKAEGKCCWLDTGKSHGDGTPVMQLRWYESVINELAIDELEEVPSDG